MTQTFPTRFFVKDSNPDNASETVSMLYFPHINYIIYPCRASTITCFPQHTMKEETWFGECLCLTNVVIALHIVNHIIYLRFVSFESTSINAERVLNFGSIGFDMTKNELRASNFLIEIEEVYAALR